MCVCVCVCLSGLLRGSGGLVGCWGIFVAVLDVPFYHFCIQWVVEVQCVLVLLECFHLG